MTSDNESLSKCQWLMVVQVAVATTHTARHHPTLVLFSDRSPLDEAGFSPVILSPKNLTSDKAARARQCRRVIDESYYFCTLSPLYHVYFGAIALPVVGTEQLCFSFYCLAKLIAVHSLSTSAKSSLVSGSNQSVSPSISVTVIDAVHNDDHLPNA